MKRIILSILFVGVVGIYSYGFHPISFLFNPKEGALPKNPSKKGGFNKNKYLSYYAKMLNSLQSFPDVVLYAKLHPEAITPSDYSAI